MHRTLKCMRCGAIVTLLKSEKCIKCFEAMEKIKKENMIKKGLKSKKWEEKRYKKF